MEVFKGLEEKLEVVGGKTSRAGQGSCAIRGGTGSSVTCPPLTKAICYKEWSGVGGLGGQGANTWKKTGNKVKKRY